MDKTAQIVDVLAKAFEVFVERRLAPVVAAVGDIRREVDAHGFVTRADVARMLEDLPKPERVEPLHLDTVKLFVLDEVGKAVGLLPKVKEGDAVTIEQVEPLLRKMVDAIPRPKDCDMREVRNLVGSLVVAEVTAQVAEIPRPKDGSSVTLEDVAPLIESCVANEVGAAIRKLPPAEPGPRGEPGANGADADPTEIVNEIRRQFFELKPEIKGERGEPGESVHPDTVARLVAEAVEPAVAKAIAALPPPKDGEPGKDADPLVMARAVTDEVARQFEALRPQLKGEPGAPGQGVDDFSIDLQDDGRTLVFGWANGEKTCEVYCPWPIYRGVYESGRAYKQGDVVTFAGSTFSATRDTTDRPESKGGAWILTVKRGKDA